MANTVTEASAVVSHKDEVAWSETNVQIQDVLDALDRLRSNEVRAATRTSVATLVMVCRNEEEVAAADGVIAHLGARHPARVITLLAPDGAWQLEDNIDAQVIVHASEAEGHAIWSDEVRLTVRGGPARHSASLLRPLQLGDLPVVVCYIKGLPNPEDPLLKLANAIIVDTKTAAAPGDGEIAVHRAFDKVSELFKQHTIIDLSWSRLLVWRRLLASEFNGEVYRPFLEGVERIEISGKLGPRTLLAGWLGSRLRVDRDIFHLYDARHVAIAVFCKVGEQTAEFRAERMEGERLVKASAVIEGGPSHSEILGLPNDALPVALSDSLKRIERDRVYEQSIKLVGSWA